MKLGPSFAMLVVGSILTFAVHAHLAAVNLRVAGVILMLAGIAATAYHLTWADKPRRTDVIDEPGHTTYLEPSELRDPQHY